MIGTIRCHTRQNNRTRVIKREEAAIDEEEKGKSGKENENENGMCLEEKWE